MAATTTPPPARRSAPEKEAAAPEEKKAMPQSRLPRLLRNTPGASMREEAARKAEKALRDGIWKRTILSAMEHTLGNLTAALAKAECSRAQYRRLLAEDKDFHDSIIDVKERVLDFGESCLYSQMKNGSTQATIFFLRTQGKRRGWVLPVGNTSASSQSYSDSTASAEFGGLPGVDTEGNASLDQLMEDIPESSLPDIFRTVVSAHDNRSRRIESKMKTLPPDKVTPFPEAKSAPPRIVKRRKQP